MIYLDIFLSFCQIGLLSFGGGYAALPLIEAQVLEKHNWLTLEEFADLLTISQMTPGPIAINAATFVGTKVAGLGGAIVATIGSVTPSFIIVLILSYLYFKYTPIISFSMERRAFSLYSGKSGSSSATSTSPSKLSKSENWPSIFFFF
jgi:chromate transport protein ChrA